MARALRLQAGLLACAIALTLPAVAQAGAWTKSWGEYYTKIGADFYKSGRYVDPATGEAIEGSDFFGQQYSIYAEFGLPTDVPLQISVQFPLTVGTTTFEDELNFEDGETGTAVTTRLGDLRIQLQGSILNKGFQLSPAFELKVPLYANGEIGQEFGVWRQAFPLAGDGQLDLTGWLLLGGAIPDSPVFMQGGLGYRHRTEVFVDWETDLEFVDGLPFTWTLGVTVGPVLILAQVDGIKNFREDEVTGQNVAVGGGVFISAYKGLAIEARVAGEVWAKNASQGVSFGLGLSWRVPYPGYESGKQQAKDSEPTEG